MGIACTVIDYSFLYLSSALNTVAEPWAVAEREMTCMCTGCVLSPEGP